MILHKNMNASKNLNTKGKWSEFVWQNSTFK